MNILILEDRGSVSFYMAKYLEDEGYTVFQAHSIADAQSYYDSRKIDCIIADLNMIPDGLTPEEKSKTKNGLLAGWVWLNNYVFRHDNNMRDRTIIYTEYLAQLKRYVPRESYETIKIIPKRGSSSSADEIIKHIDMIRDL